MSIHGFRVRDLLTRCAAAALVLLGAVALGPGASASTVYTYSFSETGPYHTIAGDTISSLTGSFSGTDDGSGHISLGTLTDFHATFDLNNGSPGLFLAFGSGLPTYFSYLIGDDGGAFAVQAPMSLLIFPKGSRLCVGIAVSALCNGDTSRAVLQALFTDDFTTVSGTAVGPTVTLVSAVTPTPIPGSLLLFATALGLGGAGAWWRKSAAA